MKKRVYVESSVISYLTARPSRGIISLAAWLKSRNVVADEENRERQVFKKRCGSWFFENPFARFAEIPGGEAAF